MTKNPRPRALVFIGAMILAFDYAAVSSTALDAQPTPKPKESIRGVREILSSMETTGSLGPLGVLRDQASYRSTTIDSLVTGLERLSQTGRTPMTRISAVITLSAAGTGEQPLPGMVNRLKNIYKQSDDRFVRGSVVAAMQGQKDRKPAIAFLKSIASEDPNHQDFPEASLNAVSSLSKMGQDGLAALRDLRQANSVADPSARGFIDWYLGKPAQR